MAKRALNEYRKYIMELGDEPKKTKKKVNTKFSDKGALGRKPNNPDITYQEVPKTKKDPTVIDSVIAFLAGKTSERFTKMARRYARAKRIEKMLAMEKKKLNIEVKDACEELFEAADDVYTRVVDTATMVFKLSKAGESENTKFDKEAYMAELEQLSGMAIDELEKLKKKHETIIKSKVASKLLTPKEKGVSVKTTEAAEVGSGNKLHQYACNIADDTQEFLKGWDAKFEALQHDIANAI